MEQTNITTIVFSVISIAIGLIVIVNEEYRFLIISTFSLFIAGFFLYSIYARVDKNSENVKKINEKLKIHKELIDIKANIEKLKRGRKR